MFKTAILAAAAIVGAQAVTTNYTSTTDPTKINIPDIDQTTSHDPAKECTYYESDYTYNKAEWPTVWDTATTNGMNTSAEFKALWDSIDWSKAPNVQPRAIGPDGGLVMQGEIHTLENVVLRDTKS